MGPADSRLKPEVSAPGALTYSAKSNQADVYQCPNNEQESAQFTEQQIRAVIFPTHAPPWLRPPQRATPPSYASTLRTDGTHVALPTMHSHGCLLEPCLRQC